MDWWGSSPTGPRKIGRSLGSSVAILTAMSCVLFVAGFSVALGARIALRASDTFTAWTVVMFAATPALGAAILPTLSAARSWARGAAGKRRPTSTGDPRRRE